MKRSNTNESEKAGTLSIFDLCGKEYLKEEIASSAKPKLIQLPKTFAEGVYLLSFKTDNGTHYSKIIINRL